MELLWNSFFSLERKRGGKLIAAVFEFIAEE